MSEKENPQKNNNIENKNYLLVEQIVQNQKSELEIRSKELELRSVEIEKSISYSEKALQAQKEIFLEEIKSDERKIAKMYWFLGTISGLFIVSITLLAFMGHKEVASDLMKMIIPVASVAGFALYNKLTSKKKLEEIE